MLAYVTKRQPVWLPRYGLFAFVLGLPLLAWLLDCILTDQRAGRLGQVRCRRDSFRVCLAGASAASANPEGIG